MQNSHYPLIGAFTLAQLAIIAIFGYTPFPDSEGYIFLANECLEKGEPYPVSTLLYDYPFLWNIGAINLVALTLKLFGSITPLLVFYALLKGITAWLCYDIMRLLTRKHTVAMMALWIYVLYPANYGEATSVLGELPFIFLVMVAIWLTLARRSFFLAGVVLAIAGWIRPFALVFLAALVLYLFWQKEHRVLRTFLRLIGGYIVAIALIGTLTSMRTGLFLYQAKTGWMALMQHSWDNSSDHTAFPTNPETIGQDSTLNVSEKDAVWRSMFFSWLSQNPMEYVRQMPAKLVNTYASDNVNLCAFLSAKAEREYLYDELSLATIKAQLPRLSVVQWLAIVNLLFYYALLITALFSLKYFSWQTHLLPVAVVLFGTLMLLLVGHGETRFHQPFMPFIIMLAAYSIHRITLKKNKDGRTVKKNKVD